MVIDNKSVVVGYFRKENNIDKEIWNELYSRLNDEISTVEDEKVGAILKGRIVQIQYLLSNLDANIKAIKEAKENFNKSDIMFMATKSQIKANEILNRQLKDIYDMKKQQWKNGEDSTNKREYLEKLSALATIFERFDENMGLLGIRTNNGKNR